MKKIIPSSIIFIVVSLCSNAQCTCNYSYIPQGERLDFTNLSVVSNSHFYWNFGDGIGSNEVNPSHVYPDNGKYLVTLYALDTISNCSNYYETWITVVKGDTLTCYYYFTDSIVDYGGGNHFGYSIYPQYYSCDWLRFNCNVAGPAQWYCNPGLDTNWGATLFVAGLQANTYDSINDSRIYKEYYKTVPFQFSPNLNYQNCSPNFEITVEYRADGALVKVAAMNKEGTNSFRFNGNPIYGDTASHLYSYISYRRERPEIINYQKSDSAHGCLVKGTQEVLLKNPFYTWPLSCEFGIVPHNETVFEHSSVQFIISSNDSITKQWQQDAGVGFVNLTNAGPYSGVNTDTLTISNVQLIMNSFHYRCHLEDPGGCYNTSSDAILYVQPIGINEQELIKIKIFPNPATDYLTFVLPQEVLQLEFEICDLFGKVKIGGTINSGTSNVDVSDLAQGIYALQIKVGADVGRQKFIKK